MAVDGFFSSNTQDLLSCTPVEDPEHGDLLKVLEIVDSSKHDVHSICLSTTKPYLFFIRSYRNVELSSARYHRDPNVNRTSSVIFECP